MLQRWGGPDGLSVLAAGTLPPNPAELLGSQHMFDLVSALESRAIVIIDAPPLIPVTDAAVLSLATGGALLVVAVNKVRRDQVRQSMTNLETVGGRLLGTIANMVPSRALDAYGQGYSGAYGYSGSKSAKDDWQFAQTSAPPPN